MSARKWPRLVTGALLALLFPLGRASAMTASPKAPSGSGPYTSASECAKCHPAIYKYWIASAHAQSATSPAFGRVLEASKKLSTDPEMRVKCIDCHAPTTLVTGDRDLKDPMSREGVTCDFCHTVKDVDLDRKDRPYSLAPGAVKRGPFAYSKPFAGHQAEYSALHRASPLLCAACHEFSSPQGVPVLATYSEWKEGPYSGRGISCQDCHMSLVPGTVSREDLLQTTGPRVINMHRLVGGSSLSQLNRGLGMKVESFTSSAASAEIRLAVTNVAAGHKVPGGLPTKSVALVVGVESEGGKLENSQEIVYRREVRNREGATLKTLPEILIQSASAGQDNRIQPGETRREYFRVTLDGRSKAVVARLEYRDASDPGAPVKTTVITQERRELKH